MAKAILACVSIIVIWKFLCNVLSIENGFGASSYGNDSNQDVRSDAGY